MATPLTRDCVKVFAGQATFLINTAQAQDLKVKGPSYLEMFKGLGESVARRLEGVELATPDAVYDTSYDLDLGGRVVRLRAVGRAHSQGDQVVTVPDAAVMFTGDLVEAGQEWIEKGVGCLCAEHAT